MRAIAFSQKAFKDYTAWALRDKKTFEKINVLILEIMREPFRGTGKPEPLRHEFKGFWSRRISQEHRLIYRGHRKADFHS